MRENTRFWLALSLGLFTVGVSVRAATHPSPQNRDLPGPARVADVFATLLPGEVVLNGGMLGTRIALNEKNRLLKVDEDDLLDAFERRAVTHQDWAGEHVGKFLHAATLTWAASKDPALKAKLDRVVTRLLKTQEANGYLGTYEPKDRWMSWDVWVHKYDLIGLLTYYRFTRDVEPAANAPTPGAVLGACSRIGDLLIKTFGDGPGQRDINQAGGHVGMAPDSVLEPIVLLYRTTSEPRYLQFANYIKDHYDAPGGPAILTSLEKFKSVRHVANAKAYEMVSNFNGLLELYRVTGEPRLLSDMKMAWQDIRTHRLYLTGSTSSIERFQDDFHLPNDPASSICETCVTVSWEQMNLQLLRLTGEAKYADELERSIYNHLLAAQKPTGDDWDYYTPLEGRKPYDSATTCCHSSGPRGVALIPGMAVMSSDDGGLVVNFYNTGSVDTHIRSGRVTVSQSTNYPLDGKVSLTITPEQDGASFPLRLRLPAFARSLTLAINGQSQPLDLHPGEAQYVKVQRQWKAGDRVELVLDVPTRLVAGDHGNHDKAAMVRGPLVLAADTALNGDTDLSRIELPGDMAEPIQLALVKERSRPDVGDYVFQTPAKLAGQKGSMLLYLTPFATAGQDGKSAFVVWLNRPE